MKKNKLILFDWGGIVEDSDSFKQAWYDLFADCGYDEADAHRRIQAYELSAIKTEEEFRQTYQSIKDEFNLEISFDDFKRLYYLHVSDTKYYPEVAEYEHSLKDECYIGILSNLCIYDKERIDKQLGLANYDYVFLSFEIGYRKPNLKIFEYVLNNVPFKPEDILFIDDLDLNIEAASSLGIRTCKITGKELDKIKQVCKEFIEEI